MTDIKEAHGLISEAAGAISAMATDFDTLAAENQRLQANYAASNKLYNSVARERDAALAKHRGDK